MERNVTFESDGLMLSGVIATPDGSAGARHPAFVVLHGFGSSKEAGNVKTPCAMLNALGFATLRFDMRGCGASEGERGRLICLEQVRDTYNAVSLLARQADIDPARISLLGSSFGAAVAIYSGGADERVASVISSGGWGDGETKFRGQHKTPGAYERFVAMLEAGRKHKAETGRSLMISRYDIVPIPDHLRAHVKPDSILTFPAETAQSMFDFRAIDMVGRIAPRPLLLLHSSVDSVTPTQQSIDLFHRAGQPADLHLFAETDHFMFSDENVRVRQVVVDWLKRYALPDRPRAA